MDNREFAVIRRYLGKTQGQIAQLLGVSSRAVNSFEEGWRSIPPYIERQLLFLIHLKRPSGETCRHCWEIRDCDVAAREVCPAWLFNATHLCWFVNGTFCQGRVQESWKKKVELCRECKVFPLITVTQYEPPKRRPSSKERNLTRIPSR